MRHGGVSVAAHADLKDRGLSKSRLRHLNTAARSGVELVDSVARLACMNLVLHGVGADGTAIVPVQVQVRDALSGKHGESDVILANPPFGKKSASRAPEARRSAYDPALADRALLCAGVKANVLFFDRKPPRADGKPNTQHVWFYDLRTNLHFTLKTRPLQHADMDEFARLYRPDNRLTRQATFSDTNPQGRWRNYGVEELLARDKASLDIWLNDDSLSDSGNLPPPGDIAAEIIEDLQSALDQLKEVDAGLESNTNS